MHANLIKTSSINNAVNVKDKKIRGLFIITVIQMPNFFNEHTIQVKCNLIETPM